MAFRFQRRIRLAPGVRLNLSKRGLGLSVGPRGASLSMGPRGVHGHAGIPGTGLAYRRKLSGAGARGGAPAAGATSARAAAAALEGHLAEGGSLPVQLEVESESGQVSYFHGDGSPMSDAEARVLRRHAEESLREQLQAHCERLNADLDRLGRLHEETPTPSSTGYVMRDFAEPPPAPFQPLPSAWWHALWPRSEEHTSELQSRPHLVCRLLLEKKKTQPATSSPAT